MKTTLAPVLPESCSHFLQKFWNNIQREKGLDETAKEIVNPERLHYLFGCLGLGLEPTYSYLYQSNESFNDFKKWLLENANSDMQKLSQFENALKATTNSSSIQKCLNKEQIQQWENEGYLIIEDAIPEKDCDETRALICDFLGIDENEPKSWYKSSSQQKIMVQLFNHPILNKNRHSPIIKAVYEELWNRNDLIVSTDRVGFNPPENENYKFPGPDLHWDVSLKTPIPFGTQGLLYLSDVAENQGAFTLVPAFHRKLESWLNSLGPNQKPREENLHALGSKPISAKKGDFIIWNQALPHGSSPNTASRPRYVQYINYEPLDKEVQKEFI